MKGYAQYTISRLLDGEDGMPGRVYILEPSVTVVKKGADDTLSPASITFSSYYRDGDVASRYTYTGRFQIYESTTTPSSWVLKYSSSTNEASKAYIPSISSVKYIKCSLYAAGGTTSELASETISVLEDAEGALDKMKDYLTQKEIFNRLTNNGTAQGTYLDEDGNIYFNASYIGTGNLSIGGSSGNTDGAIYIYDADDVLIGQWDKNGLVAIKGSFKGELVASSFETEQIGNYKVYVDSSGFHVSEMDNVISSGLSPIFELDITGNMICYQDVDGDVYTQGAQIVFGDAGDAEDITIVGDPVNISGSRCFIRSEYCTIYGLLCNTTLENTCDVPLTCLKGHGNSPTTATGTIYFNNSGQNYWGRVSCYYVDSLSTDRVQIAITDDSSAALNFVGLTENRIYLGSAAEIAGNFVLPNSSIYFKTPTTGIRGYESADSTSYRWMLRFNDAAACCLGNTTTITRLYGSAVYLNGTSTAVTSDARVKYDFSPLDKYESFFGKLEPISFKYLVNHSERDHIGFKAQDVEEALIQSGLSTKEFGGFVESKVDKEYYMETLGYIPEGMEETEYSLRYTEFIALNTHMIQRLMRRVNHMEEIVKKGKNT